ncbi:MAG: DUF934 domain-containing protein [Gammaproteobacteria bacterium]|nr:DUF934 domain-containing protein [Gammaproteobacteria bacterium]
MPDVIKDGRVVADPWQGQNLLTPQELNASGALLGAAAADAAPVAVVLAPDQPPSTIEGDLNRLGLVAINFPVFTDGRCFSYARELRELGYTGEIRATGKFIRDQLFFLQRCGFTAFQFEDDANLEDCLPSLTDFSESYQAAADQPEPLFRRRD